MLYMKFGRVRYPILYVILALNIVGCGDGFDSSAIIMNENASAEPASSAPIATTGDNDTFVCPKGMICREATNWPVIAQGFLSGDTYTPYSMNASATLVIRIRTTEAGESGMLSTANATGLTAGREVAFSDTPGKFDVSNNCYDKGGEVTSIRWHQGPGGAAYQCELPVNSIFYINVRFYNAVDGGRPRFYLSAK